MVYFLYVHNNGDPRFSWLHQLCKSTSAQRQNPSLPVFLDRDGGILFHTRRGRELKKNMVLETLQFDLYDIHVLLLWWIS